MRNLFNKLISLKQFIHTRSVHVSSIKKGYEGPGRTTLTVLNRDSHSLLIDNCGIDGFVLNNGLKVIGPMAIFPKTVLYWDIESSGHINEDSLTLFTILEPKLDLLILGMDDTYDREYIQSVRQIISKYKIPLEILPVHQACSIFNFVNEEGRFVAAGLVPPKKIIRQAHIKALSSTKMMRDVINKSENPNLIDVK